MCHHRHIVKGSKRNLFCSQESTVNTPHKFPNLANTRLCESSLRGTADEYVFFLSALRKIQSSSMQVSALHCFRASALRREQTSTLRRECSNCVPSGRLLSDRRQPRLTPTLVQQTPRRAADCETNRDMRSPTDQAACYQQANRDQSSCQPNRC